METVAARIRWVGACVLFMAAAGCGSEESQLLALLRADASPAVTEPAPDVGDATAKAEQPQGATAAPEAVLLEGGGTSSYEDAEVEVEPLYGYVDASGSMRMVRGLANVPEEHRQGARNLAAVATLNRIDTPPLRTIQRSRADWQPDFNPNRFDAVLYSSESCGYCTRARSLLDSHGVSYELRDIHRDPDAKEEVRRVLGRVSVPLLGVNGTWISGYKPEAIKRALELGG